MTQWIDIPGISVSPEFKTAFDFNGYSVDEQQTLEKALLGIYETGEGKNLINSLLDSGRVITFKSTGGDPLTRMDSDTKATTILIGTDNPTGLGFINTRGEFVKYKLERVVYHELNHAVYGLDDGVYGNGNVGDVWANLATANSSVDLIGKTVSAENVFAADFYSDQNAAVRSAYLSAGYEANLSYVHWTDGSSVDVTLVDNFGGNTIDLRSLDARRILIVAQGGNDTIYGSDGGDFLWSTSGTNTLQGGKGDDVIRSRGSNDTVIGSGGNDTIYGGASGSTTLLYKNLGAPRI